MNIKKDTIEQFKDFVFNNEVEFCGNLRKESSSNENLKLYHIKEGDTIEYSPGKFRGTCEHEVVTSIIFHTHPSIAYPYPSVEDILKVLKNYNRIVRSVIATRWGVWDIKNTEKSNIYSNTCRDIFYQYIVYFLDRIGKRIRKSTELDRAISLDEMEVLSDSINRIQKITHLEIKLHVWNDIEDGMVLHK